MDTGINYRAPSQVLVTLNQNPFEFIDLRTLNLCFADTELQLSAFASHRTQDLHCKKELIVEIDTFVNDANRTQDVNEPSNIFDILNPEGSKSHVDNNNSCDGNEIDVVGDIDNEDSLQDDIETKEGRLLDDYVETENTIFTLVGFLT